MVIEERKYARVRSLLEVPHESGRLSFEYPGKGPNLYDRVREGIDQDALLRPTFSQAISLAYAAYCLPEVQSEPAFNHVKDLLKEEGLWGFTLNLWTSEGVYIYDDLDGVKNEGYLKEQLGSRSENKGVYSDDRTVRFVPREFVRVRVQNSELENNPYIYALANGEEQVEKLIKLMEKIEGESVVYGIGVESDVQEGLSALFISPYPTILNIFGSISRIHGKCVGFGIERSVA